MLYAVAGRALTREGGWGSNLRRQEADNANSASLETKERKAVEVPLPISMHAGQIIMLTKMMTSADLRFYDFEGDTPVQRWRSGLSDSS